MPTKVARQRKRKKIPKKAATENGTDSNAYEILPKSTSEREQRRLAIAQELKLQRGSVAVSAKKQKRLSKYIVCLLVLLAT